MITINRVNHSPSTGVVLVTFNNAAVVEAHDTVLYAIMQEAEDQFDFTNLFTLFHLFPESYSPEHVKMVSELSDWVLVYEGDTPAEGTQPPSDAL